MNQALGLICTRRNSPHGQSSLCLRSFEVQLIRKKPKRKIRPRGTFRLVEIKPNTILSSHMRCHNKDIYYVKLVLSGFALTAILSCLICLCSSENQVCLQLINFAGGDPRIPCHSLYVYVYKKFYLYHFPFIVHPFK